MSGCWQRGRALRNCSTAIRQQKIELTDGLVKLGASILSLVLEYAAQVVQGHSADVAIASVRAQTGTVRQQADLESRITGRRGRGHARSEGSPGRQGYGGDGIHGRSVYAHWHATGAEGFEGHRDLSRAGAQFRPGHFAKESARPSAASQSAELAKFTIACACTSNESTKGAVMPAAITESSLHPISNTSA